MLLADASTYCFFFEFPCAAAAQSPSPYQFGRGWNFFSLQRRFSAVCKACTTENEPTAEVFVTVVYLSLDRVGQEGTAREQQQQQQVGWVACGSMHHRLSRMYVYIPALARPGQLFYSYIGFFSFSILFYSLPSWKIKPSYNPPDCRFVLTPSLHLLPVILQSLSFQSSF